MPVLTLTLEGGPPTKIALKSYRIPGYPPQDDAEYLRVLCMPCESDDWSKPESEEWFKVGR